MLSPELLITLGVTVVATIILVMGLFAVYGRLYVKASSSQALIVNSMTEVNVFFAGALVLPAVHKHELIDIKSKGLVIQRGGSNGLSCKDGIRVDVRATLRLRVNKTREDVIRVASTVGAARAMEMETLEELFDARFVQALEATISKTTFDELIEQRPTLGDEVLEALEADALGYALESVTLDHVRQTPIEALDEQNILDAKGILAITKRTTAAQTKVAELQAQHQRRMTELETEATELAIELEARKGSALLRLGEASGQGTTAEEIESRLLKRLRALVDAAVEARLATEP
ncbi:MAG: SPFH domain-containing protein [Myxococcota bacterium]